MIVDGSRVDPETELQADVAVIGAGAAGIPLTAELERAGVSVILIESGGVKPSADASDLSKGDVSDPRHGPLHRYRQRVFGGTTRVWGGRVAPLDDHDFESRAAVGSSGWPISKTELNGDYRTAHTYVQAGSFAYGPADSGLAGPSPGSDAVELASRSFHQDMLWRFSPPVDLGRQWRREFTRSPTVTVLLNTTCVGLETGTTGERVDRCLVRSLEGTSFTVAASIVVVAGGGLETTRLLLASASERHPDGIGNHSGHLGRYYLSHLTGNFGPFEWRGRRRLLGATYERDRDGIYVRRTLSLRPFRQREEGLLNFRAIVAPPPMSDPSHRNAVLSAGYLAKRYFLRRIPPEYDAAYGRESTGRIRAEHLRNVVRGIPDLVTFAPWWLANRIVPRRKIPSIEVDTDAPTFYLHFDAEQRPLRDSTVTLAPDRDALGVPRIVVDWRVHDDDLLSLVRSYQFLAYELAEADIANSRERSEGLADRLASDLGVGSHHIGTTRMASSPGKGVTDPECRIHGVRNLFVASSSVFPTAGVANPTLTIVALSVRVARTIARELGRA